MKTERKGCFTEKTSTGWISYYANGDFKFFVQGKKGTYTLHDVNGNQTGTAKTLKEAANFKKPN